MSLRKKTIQLEIDNIKHQIETDFFQIVDRTQYSFFTVPLLVFAMSDYLGSLYKGNNSSKNAVAFIRKYFSHKNASYEECAGILYFVYRHGLTHERMPKFTQLRTKGRKISCYITQNSKYRHLKGFKMEDDSAKGLIICIRSLVEDLLSAVEAYEQDLLMDSSKGRKLRKKFSIAYRNSRKYHKENDLLEERKSYLFENDFDFIRKRLNNPVIFKS